MLSVRTIALCSLLHSGLVQGADPGRLRVLTYNIHHGEGTDGKFDYERLVKLVKDLEPDVIALQEVDVRTSRVDGIDQASLLGEKLGMHAVFGSAMPYAGGQYGEALLSRFPIQNPRTYPLPFGFGQEPRALLVATIVPDNGLPSFTFMGTHLCHQKEDVREEQVQEIRRRARQHGSMPAILAGDFNARPGSSPMKIMLGDDWLDATAPESVIDYIILRKKDPWRVRTLTTVDDRVVSDHRPVIVELEWVAEDARIRKTPTSVADLIDLESQLQEGIASVEDAIVALNRGMGGGVIVSEDGYVLTAAHVSGYDRRVSVKLADGREFRGRSLGAYRFADAAMVKIDGDGPFPYVPMARIGQTQVGDWCFALGHPGGLDDDRGVVARIGRVISKTDNLLRTDCRIIGGDSGCALFNARGELVGIHSRIGMPQDQNYHGPIDAFLRHWSAMEYGEVIPPEVMRGRGGFGIATGDAYPGVRVLRVFREDSPLKKGDVIREFDEYEIEDDWEFLVAMSSRKIGMDVRLRVLRDGELLELNVPIKNIREDREQEDEQEGEREE